jgi:hypothetical protein
MLKSQVDLKTSMRGKKEERTFLGVDWGTHSSNGLAGPTVRTVTCRGFRCTALTYMAAATS